MVEQTFNGKVDSDTRNWIIWCKIFQDRQAGRQTGREWETFLRATAVGKNTRGLIWVIIMPNVSACHRNSISLIFFCATSWKPDFPRPCIPWASLSRRPKIYDFFFKKGSIFFFRMITEPRGDPYTQLQLFRSKKPANSHVTVSSSFNSRADCQLPHLSALVQAGKWRLVHTSSIYLLQDTHSRKSRKGVSSKGQNQSVIFSRQW